MNDSNIQWVAYKLNIDTHEINVYLINENPEHFYRERMSMGSFFGNFKLPHMNYKKTRCTWTVIPYAQLEELIGHTPKNFETLETRVNNIIKNNTHVVCAGMFDFYKKINYDYKKKRFITS